MIKITGSLAAIFFATSIALSYFAMPQAKPSADTDMVAPSSAAPSSVPIPTDAGITAPVPQTGTK